jgi:hypothetical protein
LGVNPFDDADSDGLSNLEEFRAGTNPTDGQSRFAVLNVLSSGLGGLVVEWSSSAGKRYTVQRSADLLDGFSDIGSQVQATVPKNSFHDATATGTGPYFYRLRLEE